MARVLVLDSHQRSALATTRALGQLGVAVITADDASRTLAGASRFSQAYCVYPSPYEQPTRFIDWLAQHAQQGIADIALPMTEVTTDLLVRHKAQWPQLKLPFADINTIDKLANKMALIQRAETLGIPVPRTIYVQQASDLAKLMENIVFPAVVKPYRSRIWLGDRWLGTSVRYASNADELIKLIKREYFLQNYPFMLQEYIRGAGQGIFAIYNQGNPVAFFAHRRLREKPPSGGVSVLSESCTPSPRQKQYARQLLDDAGWHGVAMVEFKVTEDGTPYLMEVNTRFWGSLQLSIDAGVNFPVMLYMLALGQQPQAIHAYSENVRLRWWLGDLDRLYLALKTPRTHPLRSALWELLAFAWPDIIRTRHEIFRWHDPQPAWHELKQYIADILH